MKHSSMRTLRVLSLLLALLFLLPTLAACSSEDEENGILSIMASTPDGEEEEKSYNAVKALSLPGIGSQVQVKGCRGDLLSLYSEDKSAENFEFTYEAQASVYNIATGKTLYTKKKSASRHSELALIMPQISLYGCGLFLVVEVTNEKDMDYFEPEYTYTLYNAEGASLLIGEDKLTVTEQYYDETTLEVECDGTTYLYDGEKGKLEKKKATGGASMTSDPVDMADEDANMYAEGYVFDTDSSYVRVFEKESGEMVAFYAFPSFASSKNACPLNNGNVLIQYLVEVPQQDGVALKDSDYDIERRSSDGSTYYTLTTLLLSADGGKTSEVDLPYLVESIVTEYLCMQDSDFGIKEGFRNLALAIPIPSDKLVDTSDHAEVVLKMDNDGSVTKLEYLRGDQLGLPTLVYKNRYLIRAEALGDGSSRKYLYDEKGKLIGDVTGSTLLKNWIVSDTGVFDYDGKLLLDMEKEKVRAVTLNDDFVLFADTDEEEGRLYLFTGTNDLKFLANSDKTVQAAWDRPYGGCFLLSARDEKGKYTYKLYCGDKVIGTFDHEPEPLTESSVGLLIRVQQEEKTLYYLLYADSRGGVVVEPSENS